MISGTRLSNDRKSESEEERHNSHPNNSSNNGKLKANDYFVKSNKKDILSAISLSESEEELPEASKDTLKAAILIDGCQSKSNSKSLNFDTSEEEESEDNSRRHTLPSSSVLSSCDNNKERATTCSHSPEMSRRHTFPSSNATPRPSIHKMSCEKNSESEDSSSNKKSFYGSSPSNMYPFSNKTTSENRTLPRQPDDKKRKLNSDDEESTDTFKEPSPKKKNLKKVEQLI